MIAAQIPVEMEVLVLTEQILTNVPVPLDTQGFIVNKVSVLVEA